MGVKGKPGSYYFFKEKENEAVDQWQYLRRKGKKLLSKDAQIKLEG